MENLFVGTFTIGQTIDRGVRLYKKTIGKILFLILVPCILGLANMKNFMVHNPANPFAAFNALYFLSILIGMWAWIVVVRYLYKTSIGENLEFGAIIKLAKPADLLYIITAIIWYLAMFVSIIALIIPGIYLINIAMVGMIVVTVEQKYFFNGLKRTFSITKGRWWKTFVINLVTYFIVLAPMALGAFFLMGSVFKAAMEAPEAIATTGMMPDLTSANIVGIILYILVIALIYPLFATINIVHYNSLRSEKENVDLDSQLDSLGETTEQKA
jgi:hypothetical protein